MIKERLKYLKNIVEHSLLSKHDLAMSIGVSDISIRDLLNYGKKAISNEKFVALCKVLDLNPNFFYKEDIPHPFLNDCLYRFFVNEIIELIEIFSLPVPVVGIILITGNEAHFLILKHENVLFLIAKKKRLRKKVQSFGKMYSLSEGLQALSDKINLEGLATVTLDPAHFIEFGNSFHDKFFSEITYKGCMRYFKEVKPIVECSVQELEILYWLRQKGIHTLDDLRQLLKSHI